VMRLNMKVFRIENVSWDEADTIGNVRRHSGTDSEHTWRLLLEAYSSHRMHDARSHVAFAGRTLIASLAPVPRPLAGRPIFSLSSDTLSTNGRALLGAVESLTAFTTSTDHPKASLIARIQPPS